MGSRPWRRIGVPPMPALIPIAALRNKSGTGGRVPCLSSAVDNNNSAGSCEPCERQHRVDSGSEDTDDEEVSGGDGNDTVHSGSPAGGEENEDVEGMPLSVRQAAARGECIQRSRRTQQEPITAAARRRKTAIDHETLCEQAPARRPRPERHRKSDRRRREHRSDRLLRKRSTSSSSATTITTTTETLRGRSRSPQQRVSKGQPRVNPIFVWIRQEDTRIVDVRCEDYDKRNRILLTKTAHGWRAIPRTETLTTTLEDAPASATRHHHHEHRHERSKGGPGRPGRPRGRKNSKSGRKHRVEPQPEPPAEEVVDTVVPEVASRSPLAESDPWCRAGADIESHLPSHTITVPNRKRTRSMSGEEVMNSDCYVEEDMIVREEVVEDSNDIEEVPSDSASVNSGVAIAQALRTSDASPLDNLLAVAELEFNHEVRRSFSTSTASPCSSAGAANEDVESDTETRNRLRTNSVTESCADAECVDISGNEEHSGETTTTIEQENCDYNEDDDENQFSDVLDRLEQSLQSPIVISSDSTDDQEEEEHLQEDIEINEEQYGPEQINEAHEKLMEELEMVSMVKVDEGEVGSQEEGIERCDEEQQEVDEEELEDEEEEEEFYDSLTEKSQDAQNGACEQATDLTVMDQALTVLDQAEDDLMPTDLTTRPKKEPEARKEVIPDDLMPTDLSIRKHSNPSLTIEPIIRPPSQNSETIQSPQPSGIPAVPPSPDIYPITKQINNKSIFLESLLSASPKLALNPELTITRNQKEPLDLGKGRKSASPTVTCSEEAKTTGEPPPKRIKMEDITLKNLLHAEGKNPEISIKPIPSEKKSTNVEQSSRLLELLTADNIPDAMTQLKQLLTDPHINIPDPMLVPKDRLSHIMMAPAKEIPRLLVSRPELRLPEAFTHPSVMNDPDILVISMDQLKVIVEKNQPIPVDSENKPNNQKEIKKQPPEKIVQKEIKPVKPIKNSNQQIEYQRYAQNMQHQQLLMQEQQMQQIKQNQIRKTGLANDIDAATTAAFNQMMWLPYLNQLEAQAMSTGNQQEFMKMLNTIFPPGGYPPTLPDHVPPMYNPGRFAPGHTTHPFSMPIDYNQSSLELALWQEAMLRQKPEKVPMQHPYKDDKRNYQMMVNKNKIQNQHMMNEMHNGHKQKNGHYNDYLNLQFGHLPHLQMPNMQNLNNQNLNNYNFGLPPQMDKYQRPNQNFGSARTNQIQPEKIKKLSMGPPTNTHRNQLQIPLFNTKTKEIPKGYKYGNPFIPKKEEKEKERIPPRMSRVQNLPPSPCKEVISNPQPFKTPGEPHTPIDLSGVKKFKDLEIGLFSFGKDDMEVGSTTEEMASNHLENPTHHVWNPLFGK